MDRTERKKENGTGRHGTEKWKGDGEMAKKWLFGKA
jgi:hypothetical protein